MTRTAMASTSATTRNGKLMVRAAGLSKLYRIGGEQDRYRTLRDSLVSAVKRPIARIRHPGAAVSRQDILWALKDVDVEVHEGEVLGIIGRNGAGKSTLLKVLSRITEPTEGVIELNGRVGSLLEVGTGFHPELTGRENIYLNGAILGMARTEIKRKFDEIVEFSEIGRFLDTPVKRYSSGMYVRLAFSVAAHLEPEILVVDEVLAVGDVNFQRKCLGKMEDVATQGRTVLFVSHNMHAIRSLCTRAIELADGRVVNNGETTAVVDEYLRIRDDSGARVEWGDDGPGDEDVRLTAMAVTRADGEPAQVLNNDQPITVLMELDIARLDDSLCIGFDLATADGSEVLRSYQTDLPPDDWPALVVGRNILACEVPEGLLNEGRYLLMPRISLHMQRWIVHGDAVISFEVHRIPTESPYTFTTRPGPVAPLLSWRSGAPG